MVSARYEKEIAVRMEFEEKQMKLEKHLKAHKKLLKDTILNNAVRVTEKERLETIAENRKKAEF